MPALIWTKTYDLLTKDGNFRIYISEDKDVCFYASCLYYEGDRILKSPGQPGFYKFDIEKKFGKTEKDVFVQIEKWAKDRYGDEIKITERK